MTAADGRGCILVAAPTIFGGCRVKRMEPVHKLDCAAFRLLQQPRVTTDRGIMVSSKGSNLKDGYFLGRDHKASTRSVTVGAATEVVWECLTRRIWQAQLSALLDIQPD